MALTSGVLSVVFSFPAFIVNSVVVATSPSGALISVNDEVAGETPVTLKLKRGTYTIEATREGYVPAQHAVFVSPGNPNLVNIQLVPLPRQWLPSDSDVLPNTSVENIAPEVMAELGKLKAALISDPDEALSLPLLRERLRVQEELTRALRDDLKDLKGQTKWYLGSMITMVIGLLAVIATLFVAQWPRKDA